MNNFDIFKDAYIKCITESNNKSSAITLDDLNNLKRGDVITLKNFSGKTKKYHFEAFAHPEVIDERSREIFVSESPISITIKLPEWQGSAVDLINIKKNTEESYNDNYTFFITGVSDTRNTYYAVGCRAGFEKPNYSRIQKRMGERFFAYYYTNGIKKSFKSYDSLVKFCSSLNIKSAIPAEADLIDNTDSVYYLQ